MTNDPTVPACRSCGAPLTMTFVDLGDMPLANALLDAEAAGKPEPRYPLHPLICETCLLVQVHHEVPPEKIFGHYVYFSSYSDSWLEHAKRFADEAIERWHLGPGSRVIEVASNDGYLLRHFVAAGIPSLGIEPAGNVAEAAVSVGVPTEIMFLTSRSAAELTSGGRRADLVVANNVLAHVPDLNDFIAGLAQLLAEDGVLSVEFPHLLNLVQYVQFDTIYHEHYSYLSLFAVERAFARHGLRVFDVQQLVTHGGSLRVLACHAGASHGEQGGLARVRSLEHEAGIDSIDAYRGFAESVAETKRSVAEFFARARAEGATVVAYGAAAKGNTLLNACGLGTADIAFVVDRNPHKQGMLLPGSRLVVRDPEALRALRPDYVFVLPWNLFDEIRQQLDYIHAWGGRFVIPIPKVAVV